MGFKNTKHRRGKLPREIAKFLDCHSIAQTTTVLAYATHCSGRRPIPEPAIHLISGKPALSSFCRTMPSLSVSLSSSFWSSSSTSTSLLLALACDESAAMIHSLPTPCRSYLSPAKAGKLSKINPLVSPSKGRSIGSRGGHGVGGKPSTEMITVQVAQPSRLGHSSRLAASKSFQLLFYFLCLLRSRNPTLTNGPLISGLLPLIQHIKEEKEEWELDPRPGFCGQAPGPRSTGPSPPPSSILLPPCGPGCEAKLSPSARTWSTKCAREKIDETIVDLLPFWCSPDL